MYQRCKWYDLWDLASQGGVVAKIKPDPETPEAATLEWPDGSIGRAEFYDGRWHIAGGFSPSLTE